MNHVARCIDPGLVPFSVFHVVEIETLSRRHRRVPVLENDAVPENKLNAASPDRQTLNVLRRPFADPKIELSILRSRTTRIRESVKLLHVLNKLRFGLYGCE